MVSLIYEHSHIFDSKIYDLVYPIYIWLISMFDQVFASLSLTTFHSYPLIFNSANLFWITLY